MITFFNHRPYFVCLLLSLLSEIRYMTLFLTKNLYFRTKHSSIRPTSFFSQFVGLLCHESYRPNTTSRNIGGPMHGPHFKFLLGDRPPVPRKSPPVLIRVRGMRLGLLYMYMTQSHF